ncbi:MAG: ATPase, T2SS/T4P/T4SS family, partial [Nitrospinota bacterium]|nr:ATPase, T2SS/T4P/T4SS family [Nitrospinota bacterium]
MKLSKLFEILYEQKLIDQKDYNTILDSEGRQKKLLKKTHKVQVGINSVAENINPEISPFEIISSLKIPNRKNKSPVTENIIMEAVAKDMGYPYMKLNPLKLDIDIVTKTIPKLFAIKHLLVPVSLQNGELTVALYDPYDMEIQDNIKKVISKKILFVVGSRTDILKIINEFFGFKSSVIEAEKETPHRLADLGNLDQYVKLKSAEEIQLSDEPIKNAVDFLFNYALDQKASDIHLEPKYDKTYVRLRIDGVLHDIHTIPKNVYPAFASRIKMLSKINIAERRRSQDGRIKIGYENKEAEVRVSTMAVA